LTEGSTRTATAKKNGVAPHNLAVERLLTNQTDAGNADWFAGYGAGKVLYRHDRRCWVIFDGVAWREDRRGAINGIAEDAICALLRAAAERRSVDASRLAQWAAKSLNRRPLENMLTLAQHKLAAPPGEAFDADPMLLAVQNGVLDLRTGHFRAALPEDYISRVAGVRYEKNARCPTFKAFMQRIFDGDSEMVCYLQRAIGYTLTGSTDEQVLFLLYGDGSNGKTTLCEDVLQALLGEYAQVAAIDTFLERRGDRNSTSDLARLDGARLVLTSESDANRRLGAGIVKQITGGDRVTARFQYGNEFTYSPRFKLWMMTNHRPQIPDSTHGMWRRVRYVECKVKIPEAERDLRFKDKLLAELPGILNWANTGTSMWLMNQLRPPASAIAATEAYRLEQDTFANFIAECCEVGPEHFMPFGGLFDAYKELYGQQGFNERGVLSMHAFSRRLDQAGFAKDRRTNNTLYRLGLRLRSRR